MTIKFYFTSGILACLATLHASGATAGDYPINFAADAKITVANRHLDNIGLVSPSDGSQSAEVGQKEDRLLYHDLTKKCFSAMPGESLTPQHGWTGDWMHGYLYLDFGNDGQFSATIADKGVIPPGSDVVTFSNYNGYNSISEATGNGNVGTQCPSFILPNDTKPGLYRLRYKVDWNSIDPGGNDANGSQHAQLITANNGAIADIMLYVHNNPSSFIISSPNGKIKDAKGNDFTAEAFTAGEDMELVAVPDEGYRVKSVTVTSGYDVTLDNGVVFAMEGLNRQTLKIPSYLIVGNKFTIPALNTYGDVALNVEFTEDGGTSTGEGGYTSTLSGQKAPTAGFTKIELTSGGKSASFSPEASERHFTYSATQLSALSGSAVKATADYTGSASKFNLYIDFNQDGVFSAADEEMIASASAANAFGDYTLPTLLPNGVYRARIEAENDCDVDFPINIHAERGDIYVDVMNGYAMSESNSPLALTLPFGSDFKVVARPTLPGFDTDKVLIRTGHNLYGPQMISGNRQWSEVEVDPEELATVAAMGDVCVIADFQQQPDSEWTAIWSDEFDRNELDKTKWSYHPRQSSTWNKLIAKTLDGQKYTNRFEDGIYKSYSIATPADFTKENAEMITGAIYSGNKFYFKGGRIECRLKTLPHSGNFPAFWLMPQTNTGGWPVGGEIDVWEQIDATTTSYHTIHSGWRYESYGTVSRKAPNSGGTSYNDASLWHVYTLDWTDEDLKWYIDGELKFTYTNQHWSDPTNEKYTEAVTWPFDKPFYVILNQSVGDGSWAAKYDKSFDYRTDFDYVRVYQKKSERDYYTSEKGHVTSAIDEVESELTQAASVEYFTLQGVAVDAENLRPGIYVRRQGSVIEKVIIR